MIKRLCITLLLFSGLLLYLRHYSKSPDNILFVPSYSTFKTASKQVALTFDDGPQEGITDSILNILDRHNAKATFFVNGYKILAFPELGKEIVARGHHMANHTFKHERMVYLSYGYVKRDLEKTDSLIITCGQEDLSFFRAPFGDKYLMLPLALWEMGKKHISWDIHPIAQYDVPLIKEKLVSDIVEPVKPGSIILLHDGWSKDTANLLDIIETSIVLLKQKGYSFVTIEDVID